MARRVPNKRPNYNPSQLPCTISGCRRWFRSIAGRTNHIRSQHQLALQRSIPRIPSSPSPDTLPSTARHANEHYINIETSDDDIPADGELTNSFRSPSRLSSEFHDEYHLNFSLHPHTIPRSSRHRLYTPKQ